LRIANKGVHQCQANASGMDIIRRTGNTLVVANNYNDSISVIDTATPLVRSSTNLRRSRPTTRATNGAAGARSVAVVMKGTARAYVSSDRDREWWVVERVLADRGPSDQAHQLTYALGMTLNESQSNLMWPRTTRTR